jgi:hypothetical protein
MTCWKKPGSCINNWPMGIILRNSDNRQCHLHVITSELNYRMLCLWYKKTFFLWGARLLEWIRS